VFSIGDRFGAAASKAKLIGRRVCGVIAMFDLEANKAIALPRIAPAFFSRRSRRCLRSDRVIASA
jgi:hypothetical protein